MKTIVIEIEINMTGNPDKETLDTLKYNLEECIRSEPGVTDVFVEQYD